MERQFLDLRLALSGAREDWSDLSFKWHENKRNCVQTFQKRLYNCGHPLLPNLQVPVFLWMSRNTFSYVWLFSVPLKTGLLDFNGLFHTHAMWQQLRFGIHFQYSCLLPTIALLLFLFSSHLSGALLPTYLKCYWGEGKLTSTEMGNKDGKRDRKFEKGPAEACGVWVRYFAWWHFLLNEKDSFRNTTKWHSIVTLM